MGRSSINDVEDTKRDLAGRSLRGSASLFASEVGSNIFRLLGTVVMARLLTPEHFGLVGMVTALAAFAEMFKDLGLGTATIQQKEITHEQISTLFWVNVAIGVGFMLAFAGCASLISRFYGDERLFWICLAISSTFVFGGLTVQHQAVLRRQMNFPQLASIQFVSTAVSMVVGIVLAWQGLEYWALVWKEVSRGVVQMSGTWVVSQWRPGLPVRGAGVRNMLRMGSHVTGFNVLVFASKFLDQVLLGKLWGAEPVGLYKQAGQLLRMPVNLFIYPVTYVMTPALSSLQRDPDRYRSYFNRVVSFLAFIYIPLIVYVAAYSESLITLVLGEKWVGAVPVLQILALGAIVEPIAGTCGIVMISCGRTKDYFRLGVAQSIVQTFAIIVGVMWGLYGVAVACAVFTLVSFPFVLWFSCKDTPIGVGLIYQAVGRPLIASGFMSVMLIALSQYVRVHSAIVEIGYSMVLAPVLYLGIWLLLPGGKQRLVEQLSHVHRARGELTARIWSPAAQPVSSQ
ncbi:MAG TPA: lipopolysaccharide biosynthesis protein [Nitrospira sp.]|nr:lipopolysaccharide biosynthesis protein [Nitrospira sp.]